MSKVLAGEARAVQFPKKTLWPFLTEDDSSTAGLPLHGWQVCASPRPGGEQRSAAEYPHPLQQWPQRPHPCTQRGFSPDCRRALFDHHLPVTPRV